MKDLKDYERYIIYGLLIVLTVLVVWSIILKSNVGRYQVCCEGEYGTAYILDTTTNHLWIRPSNGNVVDLGTIERPCHKVVRLGDEQK